MTVRSISSPDMFSKGNKPKMCSPWSKTDPLVLEAASSHACAETRACTASYRSRLSTVLGVAGSTLPVWHAPLGVSGSVCIAWR